MDDIIHRLKMIIANDLDVNAQYDEVEPSTPLFEEGVGLDSISVMEFISLIEENFGFQFAEEQLSMEPFETVQTLADFIAEKTAVSA